MKWLKREERITPEPVGKLDRDSIDLELAELRHKARQKQQQLPPPDDGDFRAPGAADLHPHELEETRHKGDREVIDLHLHEYEEDDPHLPRSLTSKLFGIPLSGYFQLAVLCVIVGAVFDAGHLDPFGPGFTMQSAANSLLNGVLNFFGWALQVGWKPLLMGAAVVVPAWFAWRLLSVPFRH